MRYWNLWRREDHINTEQKVSVRALIQKSEENMENKRRMVCSKVHKVEELDIKNDSFSLHKKVQELGGTGRRKKVGILFDKNGIIIPDVKRKL